MYVEGDNELLVDFLNTTSTQIWINIIKKRNSVVLTEFLWTGRDEKSHIEQYVASLFWTGDKIQFAPPLHENAGLPSNMPQRSFSLGDEWLYLKLYCGIGSVDIVLVNIILPILSSIGQKGLIKKWFFIKYQDSDYHIRLRLQISDVAKTFEIISIIKNGIKESRQSKLIWKLLPDNYEREIERYGTHTMELCESLFYIDSMISIQLIGLLQNVQNKNLMFLWGMKLTDDFLNSFKLTFEEKINIVDINRRGFQQEFNTDKHSNDRINIKYNNLKSAMNEIMSNTLPGNKSIRSLLEQKKDLQASFIAEILKIKTENQLDVNFLQIVSSLIHMMLNRLINHKERFHEFLIHEFLFKYYKMLANRNKTTI